MPEPAFEPLFARRIEPTRATSANAHNWFETLAPRFPEGDSAEITTTPKEEKTFRAVLDARRLAPKEPQLSQNPNRALFEDVDEMARRAVWNAVIAPESLEMQELNRLWRRAEEEAADLIDRTQQKIDGEMAEAREKARNEGYQLGYQQGYQQGYAEGEKEARTRVESAAHAESVAYRADIEAFLGYIEAERLKIWERMAPQIRQFAIDLTYHIIKQQTQASEELALHTIQNALRRVVEGTTLKIRVNPSDLEMVRQHRAEILELADGIKHLEINEDRRVGKGGCIMETESGNVDARIETQVQTMSEILEQIWRAEPDAEETL